MVALCLPARRILAPLASLVLLLAMLAPGCRCSRSSADDAGLAALPEAASGVASGSATLGDARPGVTANASFPELEDFARATPAWTVRVPSEPGLRVIERSVGPVIADNVVLVGSSAIGVAALELDTGAIRWQRRGEHAPELPSVAGDELWLAGRCLGQDIPAGASACLELVDLRSGALLERAWVDAAALPPPSEERRVLGAWPRSDGALELLWAGGAEVIAIDPRRPRAGWSRYGAAGVVGERVLAALAEPDALTVIGSSGIAGFARAIPAVPGAGQVGAPRWQMAYERAPGAAGPVRVPGRADDLLIMVHDDALIGLAGATEVWRTGGIYAYAPGSVAVFAEGRALAVRMDGGLRPVVVDTRTGAVIEEWQHGPGIQVLSAVMVDAGIAMAVRLDSSLRRDAIIAYDASGRIIWAYALPMPQRRRVEPVGLAGAAGGVVGFHDARSVIWLPVP